MVVNLEHLQRRCSYWQNMFFKPSLWTWTFHSTYYLLCVTVGVWRRWLPIYFCGRRRSSSWQWYQSTKRV